MTQVLRAQRPVEGVPPGPGGAALRSLPAMAHGTIGRNGEELDSTVEVRPRRHLGRRAVKAAPPAPTAVGRTLPGVPHRLVVGIGHEQLETTIVVASQR